MDKQQAQKIIRDTFENPFDKSGFAGFIINILNRIDNASFTYQGNYIPDAYKQYIRKLERIGKFSDGENRIDILVITLQKETSLERARTMQRNFIAWYLNGSRGGEMKDAALVAFVSPDAADWRFSLVKMDYKFEKTKPGRMKVKEEFTPARRWSFLVGTNEKSHTAQSRLVNILANDEHAPTLEEIEKAFDIETVTKEFFLKYRELFLRTKEELERVVKNEPKIKVDFDNKGVDTVNFAKKLLGQIVFLYFLQKKGWFGVGRDDDWGTGSKHFLRELFEKKHSDYNNFYNDILEPLFYEALRIDRSHEDGYYSRFDCKIPFLNGGLFDPIGNYDWVHTDIIIPDRLFSNSEKTKEGDTGTGILDVFDRYNFTVKEDEPLEKEVAIDPELLGKAYEKFNAIRPDNYAEFRKVLNSGKTGEENKFNKKFGVYYTPREIVHYMCQQSLVNYLSTGLEGKAAKEDIEALIHKGEQVGENEVAALIKEQNIKEGKQKTSGYKLQLHESIRINAALIDQKLADITVCDPAVGSGAFPVGMMSEIVKTRNVLSVFFNDKDRTSYDFKRRCIEHSLYGVDIDPGAVEIAKLRLWLSLVVDEEDIKNIKPLPNLDYRIMQGNSLISEFMGINFDSDKKKKSDNLLFKDETAKLTEQFQQKKDNFLNESNVSRKSKLKEEVDELLVKIFETRLRTQKADYFNQLKDIENKYSILPNEKQRDESIKQDKERLYKAFGFDLEFAEKQLKEFTSGRQIKPFFLWNLYFSEVFHQKDGFDVVIANPPYDVYEGHRKNEITQIRALPIYNIAMGGKLNAYKIFLAKSITLQKENGILCEIFQNSFLADKSAKNIRNYFLRHQRIIKIDSFPERDDSRRRVFENVKMSVCILLSAALKLDQPYLFDLNIWKDRYFSPARKISFTNMDIIKFDEDNAPIPSISEKELPILKKISLFPKLKEIADCYQGEINLTVHKGLLHTVKKTNFPVIKGAAIQRWHTLKKMSQGETVYLDEKAYLKKNKGPKSRHHNLNRIVTQGITGVDEQIRLKATYLNEGIYCAHSTNYILINDKKIRYQYLLALLNSTLLNWYFKVFSTNSNVNSYEVNNLPVCKIHSMEEESIVGLVKQILRITKDEDYLEKSQKKASVKAIEYEINQLVYKIYGFTPEEIKIVQGVDENAD